MLRQTCTHPLVRGKNSSHVRDSATSADKPSAEHKGKVVAARVAGRREEDRRQTAAVAVAGKDGLPATAAAAAGGGSHSVVLPPYMPAAHGRSAVHGVVDSMLIGVR